MANEGTPSYKYVDDKIGQVDARLDKLIQVHESDLAEQKKIILYTQRILAMLVVDTKLDTTLSILDEQRPDFAQAIHLQLNSYYSQAQSQIRKSNNPLPIATKFNNACLDYLKQSGASFTEFQEF
jgi:hypothetical protein